MTTKGKLFAVVFELQEAQINAWCWGAGCGDGLSGAIDLGQFTAVPCRTPTCPHLDREMTEPCGEVDEEPIYLRKLAEVKP